MYKDKSVAVVVPCFNEGSQVVKVLSTMPNYIDKVYVVDDASTDNTGEIAQKYIDENDLECAQVISHVVNGGVGAAIASGYKYARDEGFDIAVVMAGDAQMDPSDLPRILDPVAEEGVDYSKGNRLFSGDAWNMIPKVRYLGNSMLSLLTKIASGYWHVADSQSGYTAISKKALDAIDWDKMYKRYGQPNDLLVRLNIYDFKVRDVPIKPVYGVGEKSGLRPIRMIPKLSLLIVKLFFYRMLQKYVIRDFHPLVFFYFLSLILLPIGFVSGGGLVAYRLMGGEVQGTSALFSVFFVIMGLQFMLFAMWFDMENNKELKG